MSVSGVNQMEVAVTKWWTVPLEFTTVIPKQDIVVWTYATVGVIRVLEGYRGKKTTSLSLHQYTCFRADLIFLQIQALFLGKMHL